MSHDRGYIHVVVVILRIRIILGAGVAVCPVEVHFFAGW